MLWQMTGLKTEPLQFRNYAGGNTLSRILPRQKRLVCRTIMYDAGCLSGKIQPVIDGMPENPACISTARPCKGVGSKGKRFTMPRRCDNGVNGIANVTSKDADQAVFCIAAHRCRTGLFQMNAETGAGKDNRLRMRARIDINTGNLVSRQRACVMIGPC